MAQSIPNVPIAPGSCHLVGPSRGDMSENLRPWVGHLSILLKAVNIVPFSIFHLKKYTYLDSFIKNIFNTYALKR